MKHFIEGFVIAAIGCVIGYGIAVTTADAPEPVMVEKEVVVPGAKLLPESQFLALIDALQPFRPAVASECMRPGYGLMGDTATGRNLCQEISALRIRHTNGVEALNQLAMRGLVEGVDADEVKRGLGR